MTNGDDLPVPRKLGETPRQFAQRDVASAFDLSDLRLARLAHVEEDQIRLPTPRLIQLLSADFEAMRPAHSAGPAERVIVDQRRHRRMLATDRTLAILCERDLAELQAPAIEEQQSSNQGLAESDDQLDRFQRLERPDDAREHAQHAPFRARGDKIRRRRLGEQAAITGTAPRVKNRNLPVELKDRPVNVWFAEQHAGVVDEIARRKIVRPVDHHVEVAENVEGVRGRQLFGERLDCDVRVDVVQPLARGLGLGPAQRRGPVHDLALQVAGVDDIEVDDAEGAHTGCSEIQRGRRPEASGADQENACRAKRGLTLETYIGKGEVPRVPQQLLVRQHRQFPKPTPAIWYTCGSACCRSASVMPASTSLMRRSSRRHTGRMLQAVAGSQRSAPPRCRSQFTSKVTCSDASMTSLTLMACGGRASR